MISESELNNNKVQLQNVESDITTYEFILSSEDAKKCENDLKFAASLISSHKSNITNECVNNPNLPSCSGTSDQSGDSINCLEESDAEDLIQSWTEAPTKLLITLYKNLSVKVGKTFKLKSKKKMWEAIKIEMDKHKYNFSVNQIENRWKTLERAFRRKTKTTKRTGEGRVRCLYEKELTGCLVKNVSVFPEFSLGTKGEGKKISTMIKDEGIDLEETGSSSLNPTSSKRAKIDEKRTPTTEKGVAIELKKLRMLKEANHKEKLLVYRERTAQIKRKNDLLEKLLSSFEK